MAALSGVIAAGLLLPVASYGWAGNLALLREWYRTVTETTAPNLMVFENVSFASMWAKWIGQEAIAARLALATSTVAFLAGFALLLRRRHVREAAYLECAFFFVLIPLLSPQGWDYVLLLAMPAYMLLVDRWADSPIAWRAVAAPAARHAGRAAARHQLPRRQARTAAALGAARAPQRLIHRVIGESSVCSQRWMHC